MCKVTNWLWYLRALSVIVLFVAFSGVGAAGEREDAHQLLVKADRVRAPWDSFKMTAYISREQAEEELREEYRVFVKEGIKTLVVFVAPVRNRGNILLMVGDNLWFYVSGTQRELKVTPLQRLSGGTSYGDIARLNWADDYDGEVTGGDTIEVEGGTFKTTRLELAAKSAGVTYNRITLWVEEGNGFPRRADIFLKSGKAMKTLFFTKFETIGGKPMNVEISFVDHLANDSRTVMRFTSVRETPIPPDYFLKTSLRELSIRLATE